jgi:tRNA pseudouridine13 synthase
VDLPYLTHDLPGIGGVLRSIDDDFRVSEEPAYLPTGTGDHVMLQIRKRGLTTAMAASMIAKAIGVAERDMGWAGMKDRRAVTEQWLSAPALLEPETIMQLQLPGIEILQAARHPHKLRTGHVRSNHFVIRVRGCDGTVTARLDAARQIVARLVQSPGAPNWYGEQRFGRDGDNASRGMTILSSGTWQKPRHAKDQKRDRLLISALQSQLFNLWLQQRLQDGLYHRVIEGDVMRKIDGGLFVCEDAAADQVRMDAGAIVPTGPMFGVEMKRPPDGSQAWQREQVILDSVQLTLNSFASVAKIGSGARREIGLNVQCMQVAQIADDVVFAFTLPSGGYATAVMREVMKVAHMDAKVPQADVYCAHVE